MTVKRAQQEIDSAEYIRWAAFDRISPIGDERGDIQAAMLAMTVYNANVSKKAHLRKMEQFELKWRPSEKRVDQKHLYGKARMWAAQFQAGMEEREAKRHKREVALVRAEKRGKRKVRRKETVRCPKT